MRTRILTTHVNVAVSPKLRKQLEAEADRRRRTLSSVVRVLLEEALGQDYEEPKRQKYEAHLTPKQASRLKKLGHQLTLSPYKQLDLL